MVRQEFHGSFGSLKGHAPEGKQVAMQYLQSKEAYSSVSIGCAKSTRVSEPLRSIPKGVCTLCKRSRYKRNDDREDEDDSVEVEDTASNARKKRKIPAMVMWHLLVIARLKRLFSNPRDSELMSWYFEQ